ncbi:U4/U6.U5 small nuclear ribonucleoprotein 27 kDa protein [Cimex lectularius]|uniref:U4/U6.U5 small nuclear ribonucleoprotein 27 kDa protein n=1 Tax=Cimex lectularius TaxID=79782 RepID=A0A8I6S4W4_CIMLE|nr:U4/U6.U5 small nuclear ribonucleoprotein 27 kDa protein [Cimex lectularius]
MGRSITPPRRRRSKSRERDRDRDRRRRRSRSRDRDRRDDRRDRRDRHGHKRSWSRSKSPERFRETTAPPQKQITEAELEGKTPEEQEMMKLMGFCGFDTTKGRKVDNNEVGSVHVILKRKYRQYMNRKGGFNRPLDFVA